MSIQLNEMWLKILELLKNELTEISYNTWIKTIDPISINLNTINLAVPAEFNKGILESRYKELIKMPLNKLPLKSMK